MNLGTSYRTNTEITKPSRIEQANRHRHTLITRTYGLDTNKTPTEAGRESKTVLTAIPYPFKRNTVSETRPVRQNLTITGERFKIELILPASFDIIQT